MKNLLSLFLLLMLSCSVFGEDNSSRDLSLEYFNRITQNENVFLWKIKTKPNDELGYNSLAFVDQVSASSLEVRMDSIYGLSIVLNDNAYHLTQYSVCAPINKAAQNLNELLGNNKVICTFDIRGSEPYILVIGDNTNEIIKELKQDNTKNAMIIPSWYDYQVNH